MQLTCMAKIDDLWEDKITQVAFGAGDEGQPKHLIISNYAGNNSSIIVLAVLN